MKNIAFNGNFLLKPIIDTLKYLRVIEIDDDIEHVSIIVISKNTVQRTPALEISVIEGSEKPWSLCEKLEVDGENIQVNINISGNTSGY